MTAIDAWSPTPADHIQAQAGYLQYAVGVTILSRPESFSDVFGGNDPETDQAETIIVHAEGLMLAGLQDTVRYAHSPDNRQLIELEKRYAQAAPVLQEMLDLVYENAADQLHDLSPDFSRIRPLPVLNEQVYRMVCHSRREKLQTTRLMGAFMPACSLATRLDGRTLAKRAR